MHREEWARIVGAIIRVTGDWGLAEDAAQTAFEKAAARWPVDGIPSAPGGWVTTVARNAAIDVLRRRALEDRKLRDLVPIHGSEVEVDPLDDVDVWEGAADDRLRLMFTCAHPALSLDARVALTLHTVAGLTTREIAHAFLVSEATMAQRLVRAKRRIRGAGIPFRVPDAVELPHRLDGVLAVLYLVFSEGYAASTGEEWMRVDLAIEAIRVTRLLVDLIDDRDADEPRALLALMLLHHSRRAARVDVQGDIVPLEVQDRTTWDAQNIAEAQALLSRDYRVRGGYRVQAELAWEHARARDPSATDWPRIVELYDELMISTDSPMVSLNRAIAVAFAVGLRQGLLELERVEAHGGLAGSHLLPAARADLLRRLDERDAAITAYGAALAAAPTGAERRYLMRRIEELRDSSG